MSYISRRIQFDNPEGNPEEVSDAQFANFSAPLVLLGEPGAGKSETARNMCETHSGSFQLADVLISDAPVSRNGENSFFVIDGLDEVPSGSSETPIVKLLKRLHSLKVQKFVLTCRAADWANVQNERAIENWFSEKPIIGRLQPLNNDEIIEMVDTSSAYEEKGGHFVTMAIERDAIDLARNPQSLHMLLAAISEQGWPDTKTELYELACTNFSKETNTYHQSLNSDRPNAETILQVSGFIFVQLLLAGKRGINIDGQDDILFPRPAALISADITEDSLLHAISSKLFRSSRADAVEPAHRTVAEYLGAKWLTFAVVEGIISRLRLESILYSHDTVPTSLRGLHAWIATLDRGRTNSIVSKDPYGCLRYGDTSQYSVQQIHHLFKELKNLANLDPYFRSEDWSVQISTGLARQELLGEIIDLIKDSGTPYQLTEVILNSLSNTELAVEIENDLRQLVFDNEKPYVTRSTALDALSANKSTEDWTNIVHKLTAENSHNSLRLAIETVIDHVEEFEGSEIGLLVTGYDKANQQQSGQLSLGLDYRLFPKLNSSQLRNILPILASELPDETHNRTDYERKVEEKVVICVHNLLEMLETVAAEELWAWLKNTTQHHYRRKEWDKFSMGYFSLRTGLRQTMQILAFDEATTFKKAWLVNFRLGEISSGLSLQEDDVCFHMTNLINQNNTPSDLPDRWRNFVRWAQFNSDFKGNAIDLAHEQAMDDKKLQDILLDLEREPERDWEKEEEERQRKSRFDEKEKDEIRYRNFGEVVDDVKAGKHLGALSDAAKAYLNLFYGYSEISNPIQRVEKYVGSQNLEATLQGFEAACQREDIPSPSEASELRATEGKEYNFEKIALVGCALHISNGKELVGIPVSAKLCALTACQWGLFNTLDRGVSDVQEKLEEELFTDKDAALQFVEDVIEPPLLSGAEHVNGLYQITDNKKYLVFSHVLFLGWLDKSELMHRKSLKYLLSAGLTFVNRSELSGLVSRKLTTDNWTDDEHRKLWLAASFVVDFDRFESEIRTFSAEDKNTLWSLISFIYLDNHHQKLRGKMTVSQLLFFIETYAKSFPVAGLPSGGWTGDSPYEAAQFISGCITQIGEHLSNDSRVALENIISQGITGTYENHARHVLAGQTRAIAEIAWQTQTLESVRQILVSGPPSSIDDLQGLMMDELQALQDRIQDGIYNGAEPFWNGEEPRIENYCRDRIAEQLEPNMQRYGVRVHKEGTMPDEKRCDLLCTIGEIDLPVEIKGQWHTNLWNSACEQLEDNYSRNYRANGRGIYLVLWFGDVPNKNPPDITKLGKPGSADEMMEAILQNSPRPISPLTKLCVLDVSRTGA